MAWTSVRRLTAAALALAMTAPAAVAVADTCQGTPSAAKLVITVSGVREARGLMTASLYPDDKSQFLVKNGALKVWSVAAAAPATRLCIWLKGAGTYALAVYQDLNSNHRFDVGSLGPKEPYGFSRNPRILFSKPALSAVRFPATAAVTSLTVRLNDPF